MDEKNQQMPQAAPEAPLQDPGGMGDGKKSSLKVIIPIVAAVIVIAVIIWLAI